VPERGLADLYSRETKTKRATGHGFDWGRGVAHRGKHRAAAGAAREMGVAGPRWRGAAASRGPCDHCLVNRGLLRGDVRREAMWLLETRWSLPKRRVGDVIGIVRPNSRGDCV
jgi:hypothetical protein